MCDMIGPVSWHLLISTLEMILTKHAYSLSVPDPKRALRCAAGLSWLHHKAFVQILEARG